MNTNNTTNLDGIMSFTGHRPNKLGGYNENNPIAIRVKDELRQVVLEAIEDGFHKFIVGGAIGVDTWAAEIVIDLKRNGSAIQLLMAVPFNGQEAMWPKASKDRYNIIKQGCDKIVVVCDGGYSAHKMQLRNEWMVNRSSTVVAVWDGTSGGTGNCVEYAKRCKKHIILINPHDITEYANKETITVVSVETAAPSAL